jgi:predicted kinase
MVVDATCLKAKHRATFAALAAQLGCPFYLLFIECDTPTLRRYLRARMAQGSDISEADETVLEMQLQQLQPLTPEEQAQCFRLRCDAPFASQISDALAAR